MANASSDIRTSVNSRSVTDGSTTDANIASSPTGRSTSVIIAPARLNCCSSSPTNGQSSNSGSNGLTQPKFVLRPSVLKPPDVVNISQKLSTGDENKNGLSVGAGLSTEKRNFNFVSLEKTEIPPLGSFSAKESPIAGGNCDEPVANKTESSDDHNKLGSSDTFTQDSDSQPNQQQQQPQQQSQQKWVFGENLEHRVVIKKSEDANGQQSSNEHRLAKDDSSRSSSDSTASPDKSCPVIIKLDPDGALDLTADAQSSAEKAAEKRKYEVITGEEDEENVLTMYCRLYAWDPALQSWKERGRGNLRFNDIVRNEKLCSRIVMRTTGALRVILNTHLVAGMKFELANDYCLRFTNIDGIFLIKGAKQDIDQLNTAIDHRLREIAKRLRSDDDLSSDQCLSVASDKTNDVNEDSNK